MKRRISLLFLIAFAAFFMISCRSFNLFDSDNIFKEKDEDKTESTDIVDSGAHIDRILDLISNDDTESLLEWIHPAALDKYGREQIVDRNNLIHTSIGLQKIELKDFQPIEENDSDSNISYQGKAIYTTDYGTIEKNVTYNFIFHPKDQRWQLNWTPSVILPGLHDQGFVQIVPQKALRGDIFDRAGNPLAYKSFVNRIGVVPGGLKDEDIPGIEAAFELPEGYIQERLAQDWVREDTFVPLKTIAVLTDEQKQAIEQYYLTVQQTETRAYPLGAAAAHLIGYVAHPTEEDLTDKKYEGLTGEDFIGKSGLESIYDDQLRGKNGFKVIVTGEYEQVLLEKEAINGRNLYLTIDSDLQKMIYDHYQNTNATFTALDPKSGDLLALVSTPSYDPQEFVLGISQENYDALLNNQMKPLFNKFSAAMTPGSTEKILTSIGGFNAGTLTENTSYEIHGKGWTYDPSWGNHQVIRYTVVDGNIDFLHGIANSDNIYFARVALDMGIDTFNAQMANLQFDQNIATDYPFAVAQLTNNGPVSDTVLLADAGYGQGELLIPPAHLASVYGAVANQGVWYRPRLLLSTAEEIITEKIADQNALSALDKAMRMVCTSTYPMINVSGASLAGKSGTAEAGYDEVNAAIRQNSWFVSYDQNQRNLVLSVTIFDTHLTGFLDAVNATKDIYQTLYQNGPYSVPQAAEVEIFDASEE